MHRAISLIAILAMSVPVMAQETPEARLRNLLRQTGAELRTAQEGLATLQASLEQEKQKNASLQKQLDEIAARPPEKPAMSDEDIAKLQSDLKEAAAKVEVLDKGLKQWQGAYQKAADLARAKDLESKSALTRAAESERRAGVCVEGNTKLIMVANDILHLYQSQSFRSLLMASYEPLLGLKKVDLQNTIQDYEDKLMDHKYQPGRAATSK